MSLGTRISSLRNKRGLSQEDLANILKIGKSTLGMYETDRREPSNEMCIKIAKYFDVSLDWLLTGEVNKKSDTYETDKLTDMYSQLVSTDRKLILEFMDRLIEKRK